MNAVDYLHIIHGKKLSDLVICGYKPTDGNPFHNRAHSDLDNAGREIARNTPTMETYATIATYKHFRRTKRNIAACGWVGLDRDDLPLSSALPEPTVTIQTSPERYQDLYKLDTHSDGATVERLQRIIAAANGNGNEAIDAGRVWRVPGTINHKRGGVPVELAEYRPERLYSPHDFDHLQAASMPSARSVDSLTGIVDGLSIWQRIRGSLSAQMVALADGEAVTKSDGSSYPSGSEGDQALLTALLNAGLNDGEVEAAFMATARAKAMGARHGRDALRRIRRGIANARSFIATHPATTNLTRSQIILDMELLTRYQRDLGPYGLSVYVVLLEHDNPEDECYPSQERIAYLLNISPKQVRRETRKLAELGLIRIGNKLGTRSNNYVIIHPNELDFTAPMGL